VTEVETKTEALDPVFNKAVATAKKHEVQWYYGSWPDFDRKHGHAADTADELVHEIAHWLVAPPSRRMKPYFGLGHPAAKKATRVSHKRAEREEWRASLLGIAILHDCGGDWYQMMHEHSWFENTSEATTKSVQTILDSFADKRWVSKRALRAIARAREEGLATSLFSKSLTAAIAARRRKS